MPENERKFYVLTNEEERLYLMACPPPLQDVASVVLETGMRCGEVYRIKRDEVFLIRRFFESDKKQNEIVHLTLIFIG